MGVTSRPRHAHDPPAPSSPPTPPSSTPTHPGEDSAPPPPSDAREAEAAAERDVRESQLDAARRLAEARSFAQCWITKHRPDRLRDGVRAFTNLIVVLGKELAIEHVRTAELDPTVFNPFAVAWQNHDPARAGAARCNGNGHANGNGNGNGVHVPRKSRGETEQERLDQILNQVG